MQMPTLKRQFLPGIVPNSEIYQSTPFTLAGIVLRMRALHTMQCIVHGICFCVFCERKKSVQIAWNSFEFCSSSKDLKQENAVFGNYEPRLLWKELFPMKTKRAQISWMGALTCLANHAVGRVSVSCILQKGSQMTIKLKYAQRPTKLVKAKDDNAAASRKRFIILS